MKRLAATAAEVLDDTAAFQRSGQAGVEMIEKQYSLDVGLPRMLELYEGVVQGRAART